MKAVFLDTQTFAANISFDVIAQKTTQFISYATTAQSDVISRCIDANIIITNKVLLNKETLQQLPQLKLICIAATGINNVDIQAAKALGIAVTNVSGYAQASVAQYVFSQLFAYYTNIEYHNQNTQSGLWQASPTFCFHGSGFNEVAGKTLGIIGYGNLGKKVADIAKSFDMKVIVAERPQSKKIRPGRLAFEEVISQADIISLHCPHTVETENLINANALQKMKSSAVLINTARGAVIDEDALLHALQKKDIAYAILDVLKTEPPTKDHALLRASASEEIHNLKVTAHIAWASFEAQVKLLKGIADNIMAFKKGEQLNRVEIE